MAIFQLPSLLEVFALLLVATIAFLGFKFHKRSLDESIGLFGIAFSMVVLQESLPLLVGVLISGVFYVGKSGRKYFLYMFGGKKLE